MPLGAEADFNGVIDLIEMKAWRFTGDRDEAPEHIADPGQVPAQADEWREKLIDAIGDVDEQMMISLHRGPYAHAARDQGGPPPRHARSPLNPAHPTTTPVLCGTALKNKGVQLLLDAVSRLPAFTR